MSQDFNDKILKNEFPEALILKSKLDDDPILLETLEKQNLVLDYLYGWFYQEKHYDFCEQVNYIKNMMNIVN
jgi:hypothetical protein